MSFWQKLKNASPFYRKFFIYASLAVLAFLLFIIVSNNTIKRITNVNKKGWLAPLPPSSLFEQQNIIPPEIENQIKELENVMKEKQQQWKSDYASSEQWTFPTSSEQWEFPTSSEQWEPPTSSEPDFSEEEFQEPEQ